MADEKPEDGCDVEIENYTSDQELENLKDFEDGEEEK